MCLKIIDSFWRSFVLYTMSICSKMIGVFLGRQWHLWQVSTRAAEWLPQKQAITAFTLAQTLGTKREQCHVSLVLPAVMAFKAFTAMSFVSFHPYIVTDKWMSNRRNYLVLSSCKAQELLYWFRRLLLDVKQTTTVKWPTQSCAYRIDGGQCCRSTWANKYSIILWLLCLFSFKPSLSFFTASG